MIGQLRMDLKGAAKASYLRKTLPGDMRRALHRAAYVCAHEMRNDIVSNVFSGHVTRRGLFYESAAGNVLASRESNGARSRINADVVVRGNTVYAIAGTPDRYVLSNEVGATITPKSGRALALPTANMQTPTGRLKEEWASKLAGGGWRSLDWKNEGLFTLRAKRGGKSGGFIARRVGGGAPVRGARGRMKSTRRLELLALLVSQVNLPARHMLLYSARRVDPRVKAILGNAVRVVVMKAA